MQEEIFGPILPIWQASSVEQSTRVDFGAALLAL